MNRSICSYYCQKCTEDDSYRAKNCFTEYRVKRFLKDEYIAYKGERVNTLAILSEGVVDVETILESGVRLVTITHEAPYPIGAIALFSDDNRYRVDLRAQCDCEIIVVSREAVEEQMVKCRRFMRSFIAHNTSRFDVILNHLSLLSKRNIKAKLAYYILLNSSAGHYRFTRSISDLAIYFCVERPSLSRAIAQLVDEGVITYDRGEGGILDLAALKNML